MISSRTPEGLPSRCPLCASDTALEFSATGGDATCPSCGVHLLRSALLLARLQELAKSHPELELIDITPQSPWPLGGDSLTAVEVMLELEQELGVSITADDAERIYTVGEAIRYLEQRLTEDDAAENDAPSADRN